MFKKALTAGSFALGAAGMVLVGYLLADPRAFTSPLPPIGDGPEPTPSLADAPQAAANIIVVSEVVIAEGRSGAKANPVASREPCGSWNEVGALYVAPGGATGVRSVRSLCP